MQELSAEKEADVNDFILSIPRCTFPSQECDVKKRYEILCHILKQHNVPPRHEALAINSIVYWLDKLFINQYMRCKKCDQTTAEQFFNHMEIDNKTEKFSHSYIQFFLLCWKLDLLDTRNLYIFSTTPSESQKLALCSNTK